MNEASLTGESTPQMKEAVVADGTAAAEPLDILSAHKSHVLYSGTTLMQHSDPPGAACGKKRQTMRELVSHVLFAVHWGL